MTQNFRLSQAFTDEANGCRRFGPGLHVSDIFFPFPDQWGYRGDPYLWAALAVRLNIDMRGVESFDDAFREEFLHLTGQDLDTAPETFAVEAFSHGGMSSGGIAMPFWRDRAYPLLQQRFADTKAAIQSSAADRATDG